MNEEEFWNQYSHHMYYCMPWKIIGDDMQWIKWEKDNLPDPGQRILIAYKNGLVMAMDFFHNQEHKDAYIRGMRWNEENPNSDIRGIISNFLKIFNDEDPIVAWMPCPKAPIS